MALVGSGRVTEGTVSESIVRSVLPMPDRTDAGGPSAWVRIDLDVITGGVDPVPPEDRLRATLARQ